MLKHFQEERQTEEQDVKIETARSRRSVSTGSMTSLITNLVQQEVCVPKIKMIKRNMVFVLV